MDASKQVYPKRLKEHLQQQQEPFSLHNYLLERRYMFKNFSSDSSSILHHPYLAKNLKWSLKYDLQRMRERFLNATGILRSMLIKFIPTEDNTDELESWDGKARATQTIQQTSGSSSIRRLAVSDHLTSNYVDGKVLSCEHQSSTLVNMFQTHEFPKLKKLERYCLNLHKAHSLSPQVTTDAKPHWINMRKKRQCSAESELEEPSAIEVCDFKSQEVSVTPISTLSQKSVGDPKFSAYLRKLVVNSYILRSRHAGHDKLQENMVGRLSLRRQRDKRILQKRKQILLECVEKATETNEKEAKSLLIKAVTEPEDLQSIIHEQICLLEKQYAEVAKIFHMLHTESSITIEEWRNFHKLNGEVHEGIGDAIMDDIIQEMIDLLTC